MDLEREIMIHRYCYYVLDAPLISDAEYDILEREARATLPDTSPVQGIGSSLASSYSVSIIEEAQERWLGL